VYLRVFSVNVHLHVFSVNAGDRWHSEKSNLLEHLAGSRVDQQHTSGKPRTLERGAAAGLVARSGVVVLHALKTPTAFGNFLERPDAQRSLDPCEHSYPSAPASPSL
jgi:hypothetical protein